jgi:isopenicillin-N epimerase
VPSLRDEFLLDPSVVFLNHGSYGACPRPVFERYQAWQRELERQPVEFLSRRLEGLLDEARVPLAEEVHADPASLAFVSNATTGVNVAARAVALQPGAEVLTTDLEYGACTFAWERVCSERGARLVRAEIPLPLESAQQVVDALFAARTENTRAVFVSHLTSETALRLPVEQIVARARGEGLITVVDGAHAPGHVPLDVDAISADFYSGNAHKWICAPRGAGFISVRDAWRDAVPGPIVSWGYEDGGTFPARVEKQGTRDPSAHLTVPAALEWLRANEWDSVRARCRELTRVVRGRLSELGLEPLSPDGEDFLGQMVSMRLREGTDADELKARLYDEYRIEVPVFARDDGGPLIRVSIQAYNDEADVDKLVDALAALAR